jgi:hypothetical protein
LSFFQTLVSETESERAALLTVPQIVDGLSGRISRETYLAYLAQAYHHVRHTVPLMRLAQRRLDDEHARFRGALDAYIAEETGHEEWILSDIRHAGGDAERVRASAPGAAAELMVAFAYDYISRVNPMGFFGMVFVLEGTSVALATHGAAAVRKSLGLPAECFTYLTSHGALDAEHIGFLETLMAEVCDPADQAAIVHVAKRMYSLFADLFRSIPHERALSHVV